MRLPERVVFIALLLLVGGFAAVRFEGGHGAAAAYAAQPDSAQPKDEPKNQDQTNNDKQSKDQPAADKQSADQPAPAKQKKARPKGVTPPEARIAVCDVYRIVEEMMNSPRYKPQLEEKQQALMDQIQPKQQQLKDLRDQLQNADPKDEDTQAKYKQYQQLGQQLNQLQQQLSSEFQDFRAKKIIEAYKEVVTSADAVAAQLGYNYVIASGPAYKDIKTDDPQRDMQQLLNRPVIRSPEDSDITLDVMDDLNLS